MPNLASVLKDEITRLARRAMTKELATLKASVAQHRSSIASLKKLAATQGRELAALKKLAPKKALPTEAPPPGKQIRWSPLRFLQLREKLGLSRADMGLLVGASDQSVKKWEEGVKPRAANMNAIAAARKLGKREAHALVQKLKDKGAAPAKS